nr:immunoglobulin heavy chain junction region [Mus musculus]
CARDYSGSSHPFAYW